MKQIFFVLLIIGIINAKLLSVPITKSHNQIKHSKFYKQQLHTHALFHHLRAQHYQQLVEQATLTTTGVGFTLLIYVQNIAYEMSIDTGSSDIFIKGENTTGDPEIRYKCGQQCIDNYPHVGIGYLDGPLETYATTLNVDFNDHNFDCPLLVAYQSDQNFDDQPGLIGLSYPRSARHKPTFIQTLINEGIVDKYAYGLNLNIIQPDRAFITFGDSDEQFYQGELIMYNFLGSGATRIDFGSIKIGNGEQVSIKRALLDTGNTCISIPRQYQQNILRNFNTQSNICYLKVQEHIDMFSLLRCRVQNFDQLPTLELNIQGNSYFIQKQYYIQACAVRDKIYYCDLYIQSMDSWSGENIYLGDGFFNSFYTYFDLENNLVGIAHNKENLTMEKVLTLNQMDYDEEDWKEWDKIL